MADEFQAQVQLGNAQAHLQVIKGNILVANNELSSLYTQVALADENLQDARTTLKKVREETGITLAYKNQVEDECNALLSEVSRREKSLNDETDSYAKKIALLEEDAKNKETQKAQLLAQIAALLESREEIEKDVHSFAQEALDISKEIDSLNEEVMALERIISNKKMELREIDEDHSKTISTHETLVASLEDKVKELEARNERGSQSLDEREARIAVSEENIRRVQKRINNIFAELYPHLNAPII